MSATKVTDQIFTEHFSQLADQSQSYFALLNRDHRYIYVNQRYGNFCKQKAEDLIGRHDRDVFGQAFYQAIKPFYLRAFEKTEVHACVHFAKEHAQLCFQVHIKEIELPDGRLVLFIQAEDISEQQRTKNALTWAEQRFQILYQHTEEACCILDQDVVIHINAQGLKQLGLDSKDHILGAKISQFLSLHPAKNCQNQNVHDAIISAKNSARYQQNIQIQLHTIPLLGSDGQLLFLRNPKKTSDQKLSGLDPLTGLFHRKSLDKHLKQQIQAHQPFFLFYLDIDNFKNINDSLGHHIGDRVLQEIAHRLKKQFHAQSPFIANLGGDEFVLIVDITGKHFSHAALLQQGIDQVFQQPFDLFYFNKYLTCSAGQVCFPQDAETSKTLMQHAATALWEAKKQGRNRFIEFHPQMNKEARMRLWLEIELQKAVNNNSLEVWYQPKIDAQNGRIIGAEALVRWNHPIEGYISPGRFIPVAERSGVIEKLGRNIMREVFQKVRRWHHLKILKGRIAINLSPEQFNASKLLQQIQKLLNVTKTFPDLITFELTESTMMQEGLQTLEILEGIKALGFHLSIDDFGTGYSSLAYLAKYPLDELKIDRSFILEVEQYPKQIKIIEKIIELAKSLDLSTVAEGVETQMQAKMLRKLGCDNLQGFYFYKPMPADEFELLLLNQRPLPQQAS